MSEVSGVFGLPFAEQIDYFRRKVHLPTERWNDIQQSAHDRVFVVAGATKADLLADIWASIARNISGGLGLEGYRKDFRKIVAAHGWHGWTGEGTPGGEAWRTRVTYMTNLRTSFAAGRYRQLTESGIKFWMWKHDDLVQSPRPQHLAWDGLVLPADHPFWKRHYPPQIPPHWGCRCRVVGVDGPEMARQLGGDPDKALPPGWESVDAQHKDPALLGAGWNFAPGANAATPLREMIDKKLFKLPAPIGAAMMAALRPALLREQGEAYRRWLAAIDTDPAAKSHRPVVGAMDPVDLAWLSANAKPLPKTAEIAVSSGVINGPKAERHTVAGDAIRALIWEMLPEMLADPLAVLYDENRGTLIFVLPEASARRPQLSVEFDYAGRTQDAPNVIVSGYRPYLQDLLGRVANGTLTLMRGTLE